jgi:hypothetical protein
MKTLKITAAFLTVFFFAGFISAFSANRNDGKATKPTSAVRYVVNVHIDADVRLCSAYQIFLVDGHGNQVADPQGYIPGVSSYNFTEAASTAGVRGAMIVVNSQIMHYICDHELNSTPVFHMGPFMTGQAYTFDLYPLAQPVGPKTKTTTTIKE